MLTLGSNNLFSVDQLVCYFVCYFLLNFCKVFTCTFSKKMLYVFPTSMLEPLCKTCFGPCLSIILNICAFFQLLGTEKDVSDLLCLSLFTCLCHYVTFYHHNLFGIYLMGCPSIFWVMLQLINLVKLFFVVLVVNFFCLTLPCKVFTGHNSHFFSRFCSCCECLLQFEVYKLELICCVAYTSLH